MNNEVKIFSMAIGLPATGKTTFYEKYLFPSMPPEDQVRVSSDDFIEKRAQSLGKTYNDVFDDTIKEAEAAFFKALGKAIKNNTHWIYCDRTALTVKSRERILTRVPADYKKIAIVFLPHEGYENFLNRPGKSIPDHVLKTMALSFRFPEFKEGFDGIFIRSNNWDDPLGGNADEIF